MNEQQIGAKLKELRIKKGISYYRINKDLNIHIDRMKSYENGGDGSSMNLSTLIKILEYLDGKIVVTSNGTSHE